MLAKLLGGCQVTWWLLGYLVVAELLCGHIGIFVILHLKKKMSQKIDLLSLARYMPQN